MTTTHISNNEGDFVSIPVIDFEELCENARRFDLLCKICGHSWAVHDPQHGKCDTNEVNPLGVCRCGRDFYWMQERMAEISKATLAR